MFSDALRVGSRLNAWKTKPTWSRRSRVSALSSSVERSVVPMKTLPDVRLSRPARQCMSVDLPEPDGPMMAVNAACSKSIVTSSSARTTFSPLP
jgi:hypothetical protein